MSEALHESMLDDVAVYALGAMAPTDAKRVREHIASCAECRAEYDALRPAAGALAYSAEACSTGQNGPIASALMKQRIMRQVRKRPMTALPAYLIAAACIVVALMTTFANVSVDGRLKTAQQELAIVQTNADAYARQLSNAHVAIADLTSGTAKRYATSNGAIIANGPKIYVAMHNMPAPPKGHVYQAWTLPKGSKTMVPSVTFVPDAQGGAVVPLPQDARLTAAVAISVEPAGGSKAPTTKPVAIVTLN